MGVNWFCGGSGAVDSSLDVEGSSVASGFWRASGGPRSQPQWVEVPSWRKPRPGCFQPGVVVGTQIRGLGLASDQALGGATLDGWMQHPGIPGILSGEERGSQYGEELRSQGPVSRLQVPPQMQPRNRPRCPLNFKGPHGSSWVLMGMDDWWFAAGIATCAPQPSQPSSFWACLGLIIAAHSPEPWFRVGSPFHCFFPGCSAGSHSPASQGFPPVSCIPEWGSCDRAWNSVCTCTWHSMLRETDL
ncbi:hypothetical protein B0J13DRAFT_521540 [Dactylonectria estremocensis]|uniref:Uncharacterized protein n=1 Tax=Dactylonectria estremocensis TaxID=1079267 RepID=A0A9P9F8H8_9HYPO|nr:hypothetical protein B0J13DRAFT_521540 [Dactylonectria estremocensis]